VDELSELFLQDFKNGQLAQRGWPAEKGPSAYKVSKALMNAYTRVLAKTHTSLRFNCVNPGHVDTDGSFHTGHLTVAEGARGPVTLALAPREGATGAYFDGTEEASFV
jgi:(+)-neomenthol dehydrogenase